MKKIITPAVLLLALANPAFSQVPQLPPLTLPPPPAGAAQVQFSHGILLSEFTRLVLEDILKKPFVLSPELLSATQTVGVSHGKLTHSTAEAILSEILDAQGFELRPGAIYYVSRKKESKPGRVHVSYHPRCRPVSYFANALPGVFQDVSFSFAKSGGSDAPGSEKSAGIDFFFAHIDPAQRAQLDAVIAELDTPVPQVSVHALLLEVSSDGRQGSGVRLTAGLLSDKFALNIGSMPQNSNSIVLKAGNFELGYGAFSGDARFKTLATPSLITTHAQPANLLGGVSFPVVTATQDGDRRTESTEYKDIGTSIRITPQVVGSSITLTVAMDLSDVSPTALGAQSSPTLIKRSLTSQVVLSSGSAAVIGGLRSQRETSSKSGFLFFDNLSSDEVSSESELVLVLYADIIDDDKSACKRDA